MFRLKPKTVKNSNCEAYQLLRGLYQQNKANVANKDRVVMDAMSIYDKINEPKCDYVINALVNLCYNFRCYKTIPSTPVIWRDIELLPDTNKKKLSYALLLISCIKSNNIAKSLKTLELIANSQYSLQINESVIIKLIKLLNITKHLDYISLLMSDTVIPNSIGIKTSLIAQYSKHKGNRNNLNKAINIFVQTKYEQRDTIMNGAMMTALIHNDCHKDALNIYNGMDAADQDAICHALAVKCCTALNETKQIQQIEDSLQNYNAQQIIPVQTSLIDHYGHCGDIEKAARIFHSVTGGLQNIITVNSMLTAYINCFCYKEALLLYDKYDNLDRDSISHSLAIKACISVRDFVKGNGIINEFNLHVAQNQHIQLKHTLINFYGHCSNIDNAEHIFKSIGNSKDSVSINAMMTAYINNLQYVDALKLYYDTNNLNFIDNVSHSLAIKCCANIGNFNKGKKIHSILKKENKMKDDNNHHIKTALIDLYGRCHDVNNALHIFSSIGKDVAHKSTACCNSMMNIYCVNQKYDECLQLFDDIDIKNRNSISYTIVFTACAHDNKVELGNNIYHQLLQRRDCDLILKELSTLSSLINMFGKFGDLKKCEEIFDIVKSAHCKDMYLNNIGIWNVMIQALGVNGDAVNALTLFNEMKEKTNIKVDSKGYVTIFNALSHGQNVKEAKYIWYNDVLDANIKCNKLVTSSFVDCLARNGYLFEAYDIIYQYEKIKDSELCQEMWLSLFNGCKIHKNTMFMYCVVDQMKNRFHDLSCL